MCHARLKVMTKLCCPHFFVGNLKQKMSLWKRLFAGALFMYTFDYIARNFSLSLSLFFPFLVAIVTRLSRCSG